MILKGMTINFLGDSITQGSGASCDKARYFEVMKEKYGLKAANGYGIGGTRIARQHTPSDPIIFDEYFSLRVDKMTADADAVVVFGGTNDYGHGDAPMGKFSDRTPDTFYGACHELCLKLINKYPGKLIVFMTPLHREAEFEPHKKPDGEFILKDYVNAIREVTEYYSIPVCDLFASSGIQPCVPVLKELYTADGLHPNDNGNKVIAECLGNFMLSL